MPTTGAAHGHGPGAPQGLPAGDFASWLVRMRATLSGEADADVPCGACCACCATSHFVHVAPHEAQTLARIPRELLFPAPGLPVGHVLLGYDEQGRCPMLAGDGRCSIYEDRPLTCRTYDCRVFAAAGCDADRDAVTRQARRWRFDYPTQDDRDAHAAVQAAARFLRERAACFPSAAAAPPDPVGVALLSLEVYEVFLALPEAVPTGACTGEERSLAQAVIDAHGRFSAARAERPPGVGVRARRAAPAQEA